MPAGRPAPGQDEPVQPDDPPPHPRGRRSACSPSPRSIGLTLRVARQVRRPRPGRRHDRRARRRRADAVRVDTWLMSCRVIGRTVEQFFFRAPRAGPGPGHRRIVGEYIPTKNALVRPLRPLGFRRVGNRRPGGPLRSQPGSWVAANYLRRTRRHVRLKVAAPVGHGGPSTRTPPLPWVRARGPISGNSGPGRDRSRRWPDRRGRFVDPSSPNRADGVVHLLY